MRGPNLLDGFRAIGHGIEWNRDESSALRIVPSYDSDATQQISPRLNPKLRLRCQFYGCHSAIVHALKSIEQRTALQGHLAYAILDHRVRLDALHRHFHDKLNDIVFVPLALQADVAAVRLD